MSGGMHMKKIGFIGTGIMGSAMAGHLLNAGYEVSVYNRTKAKADSLLQKGAVWCNTPGQCAKGQDVIISIVGYPKDVEEIYLGKNGVLDNASEGAYLIDMTTSSPQLAQKIYRMAKGKGIFALDAPVTGGDSGAQNASLSILVGGDTDAFTAVKPLLLKMGTNIVYEGTAGAGQKTKACNQIAIAGALAGACEALSYAKAAGLDVQKVFDAISQGAAGSFQMSHVAVNALKGNYQPGFMLKHFIKDMKISVQAGDSCSLNMPILKQVLQQAENLAAKGLEQEGTQCLIKYYQDNF